MRCKIGPNFSLVIWDVFGRCRAFPVGSPWIDPSGMTALGICFDRNFKSLTNYRAIFAATKLINEHTRLREIWPRKIVPASPDKQSMGHEKRKMKDDVFKTKVCHSTLRNLRPIV